MSACSHGELSPLACVECAETTPPGPAPRRVEEPTGPVIDAAHEGWCRAGDDRVSVGDRIVFTSFDRWAHAGCLS